MEDKLEGDILHIKLFSFNDYSGQDVQKSLQKYQGKYKKILLDLRENGGGTLQAAVDVGSLFLKKGSVIATVEGKDNKQYVSYGDKNTTIPLFILVNANTASASEILASALNFYLKAPIIGSQTYGK
jgi:carboxyl-terminal processing protease